MRYKFIILTSALLLNLPSIGYTNQCEWARNDTKIYQKDNWTLRKSPFTELCYELFNQPKQIKRGDGYRLGLMNVGKNGMSKIPCHFYENVKQEYLNRNCR